MPQRVIDSFEVIEIDVSERDGVAVSPPSKSENPLMRFMVEETTVRERRERI